MGYQNQHNGSLFGPKTRMTSTKKKPGPLMRNVLKEVNQYCQAYRVLNRENNNNIGDHVGYTTHTRVHKIANPPKRVHVKDQHVKHSSLETPQIPPMEKSTMLVPPARSMDARRNIPKSNPANPRPDHVKTLDVLNHKGKIADAADVLGSMSNRQRGSEQGEDLVGERDCIGRVNSKRKEVDDHDKQQDHFQALKSRVDLKRKELMQDILRRKVEKDLSSHLRAEASCVGNSMVENLLPSVEAGTTKDDKLKDKKKKLSKRPPKIHGDNDGQPIKKRRKLILVEDEDEDCDDKNLASVKDGIAGLTTQTATTKDRNIKVSTPFFSGSSVVSLPINIPVWSGSFKIGSKAYGPLAGHLSTKSCDKVWQLSKLLLTEVEVTKHSRLEACPKSFEASRPTGDNIGLYFLSRDMRPDEYLDELVKEVVLNDMVLRAAVDEAEMLIFPSTLLPEQYQTFQGKHYLWGVFKRREDRASAVDNQRQSALRDSHEEDKQHPGSNRSPRSGVTCSDLPEGRMLGFIVRQNPRVEQFIEEMEREGAVVFAMQGEMVRSSLGQAVATYEDWVPACR